jgi:hypothetical protein
MNNKTKLNIKDLFEILSVGTMMTVLSVVFLFFLFVVPLVFHFYSDLNMRINWLFGLGAFTFIAIIIIFFIITYHQIKQESDNDLKERINECYNCAQIKSQDGFHYYGLLNFDELIKRESMLSEDEHPDKCKVLVYTSDLAAEINALKVVRINRAKNVHYIVLYFTNSCNDDQMKDIIYYYGEKNLIDLSKINHYKGTFDSELAETIGFDIMIYENSAEVRDGYFCVDFAPSNTTEKSNMGIVDNSKQISKNFKDRPYHDRYCDNRCNYKKEVNPFYKQISNDLTITLYREIISIYNKYIKTNSNNNRTKRTGKGVNRGKK